VKYESILDKITNTIFKPIIIWAEGSNANWNMLISISFALFAVGIIILFVYFFKMRKYEKRNQIYLNTSVIMLLVLILCDVIFPKEYMWQIFFLFKYAIAFNFSGIYLIVRYK